MKTSFVRKKCSVEGCNRSTRNKGFYKERIRYDSICAWHHKGKGVKVYFREAQMIENKKCELCGWDKGPCDRHRIEPEKGYVAGNVKILCPNCHRLVTLKLIS